MATLGAANLQSKVAKFDKLTIGTRGSPLAMRQAHLVRDMLCAAHGVEEQAIEIAVVSTAGDRIQDRSLSEIGGKGLFTKEIEERLLDGSIDLAVHSSKDVATVLPDGLVLSAILLREDPRDAFISLEFERWQDLPEGASVGSSSIRRRAQLAKLRPDIQFVEFRGNVQTRLDKLSNGVAQATFLAVAGLKRLGMEKHIRQYLERDEFLSAPGQGVIAIETRGDDRLTNALVAPLHDAPTAICLGAERAFLAALDGSCRTPIAALAEIKGEEILLEGEILSGDGQTSYRHVSRGRLGESSKIGTVMGQQLRALAGPKFMAELDKR